MATVGVKGLARAK